jgi:hypothetical protein
MTQQGSAVQVADFIGFIGVARRTGRFPQLADSRSGVDRERFATISPTVASCRLSYTGGQTRRACSGVLPVHLRKARKNSSGLRTRSKKLIPAPLMRAFFDVQVHRRD